MVNCAATTSKARGKHGEGLTALALQLCEQLQIPVIARNNKGIPWLLGQYQLDCLLVEEEHTLVLHWSDGQQLFFHPGMAVPRIKQLKDGKKELLTQVLDVQSGDTILDCTMGMANDAIVAAFAAGTGGSVTALESSPLTYVITTYGLQNWPTESWRMQEAMARIQPFCIDYRQYLAQQQKNSYDLVYFDPMFERPIWQSSGIAALRRQADYSPLTQESLELARTSARRRVVVKHRAGTLRHLKFEAIVGGKYSTLAYGVLYV